MPLSAIDFYNANATNIVNVPRVDHPEDPSGIAGVRRAMEAQYFAADAAVMSLSDACQFAEAYAAARPSIAESELAHIFTASNDCECEICERVADKFRRVSPKAICPECVSKGE